MSNQARYDRWEHEQALAQVQRDHPMIHLHPDDDDAYDKLRDKRFEEGLPAKPGYDYDWSYR